MKKPLRASRSIEVAAGLDLLGNVIGSLKIDATARRTTILENITEAFGHVNRASRDRSRAATASSPAKEGRAEFGAQVKPPHPERWRRRSPSATPRSAATKS